MEQTHARISLGTMEEMERAVEVFREDPRNLEDVDHQLECSRSALV